MDRPAPTIEESLSHAQFVRRIARGLLRDEHGLDDAEGAEATLEESD